MRYLKVGIGEYQLMLEEMLRECTPCDLGYATVIEGLIPAIVLRQPMKDKASILYRDINTSWDVAQGHGNIELLFMTIKFKASEKGVASIRICIDKFSPEVMDWFGLLVATKGRAALTDSIGSTQAIGITGVPLDVPKAILAQVR